MIQDYSINKAVNKTGQIKLDVKDNKILYELEKNARQPISQLAKKVGLSKETVGYRIKRLEKEKVIVGYSTVINPAVLGMNLYRLFFKFQNTTPKKEEEIIHYLARIPSISRLCSVEGAWDLTASIMTKDVFEFKQIYDEFSSHYGKYIGQKNIVIVTKIYHFLHNLLFDINDRSCLIYLQKEKNVNLDEIDEKIIKMLKKNCRLPTMEIAKKLGLSANAVKNRIKRLLKERAIVCFKIKVQDFPYGYQHFHILLTLQSIDKEKKDALIKSLIEDSHVYFIIESVGADLEFECHAKNISELHKFLKDLRNKFPCIRDHQTTVFCKSYF